MTRHDPSKDERLADWVDGRLGDVERERLEAEFRVHPELREAAERYHRSVEAMRAALADEPVPADLAARIRARVAEERRPRRFRIGPLLGSLAAAAALVGVFLLIEGGVDGDRPAPDEIAIGNDVGVERVEQTDRYFDRSGAEEGAVADPESKAVRLRTDARALAEAESLKRAEEAQALELVEELKEEVEQARADATERRAQRPSTRDSAAPPPAEAEGEFPSLDQGERKMLLADEDAATEPPAPEAEAYVTGEQWLAVARDVVVVVELPESAIVGQSGAEEPTPEEPADRLTAKDDRAGAATVTMLPLAELDPKDAWSQQVLAFVRTSVEGSSVHLASQVPPAVFGLPGFGGGGGQQAQLGLAAGRDSESDDGATTGEAPGRAGANYDLRTDGGWFAATIKDTPFQVLGDQDQTAALVRELSARAAVLGGEVRVLRAAAPVSTATVQQDAAPGPQTWIVVRPLTPAPPADATKPEAEQPR